MKSPFDVLHIKGRTAGSSNELSFDVLDAASSGISIRENDYTTKKGAAKVGGDHRGTYHGVSGTATFAAAPEVERRKRERRNQARRLWLLSLFAVIVFGATAVVAGLYVNSLHAHFSASFDDTINALISIDHELIEVDELMAEINVSVDEKDLEAMSSSIPRITRQLNALEADVQERWEQSQDENERAALALVRTALEARKNMLEAAEKAVSLQKIESAQAGDIEKAWNKIFEADMAARTAAQAANEARTEEATSQAREQTVKARNLFLEAKSLLDDIVSEMSTTSLGVQGAYIDKRIESLEEAIKTTDCLLQNDREGAELSNNAYNKLDAEAAALAASLPQTPGDALHSVQENQFEEVREAYVQARADATNADSAVRSLL